LAIGSFNKERMEHEQSAESCDRCGGVADVSRHPILLIAGLLPVLGTTALFAIGGPIRRLWFDEQMQTS